jgi:hypothetical protein
MFRSYDYAPGTENRKRLEYEIRQRIMNSGLVDKLPSFFHTMKYNHEYLKKVKAFLIQCLQTAKDLRKNQTNIFAIGSRVPESSRLNYMALDRDIQALKTIYISIQKQFNQIVQLGFMVHHLLPKDIFQDVRKATLRREKKQLHQTQAKKNATTNMIQERVANRFDLDRKDQQIRNIDSQKRLLQEKRNYLKNYQAELNRRNQQLNRERAQFQKLKAGKMI